MNRVAYMQQLCDALTTVLDRCAQLERRRLAGYAANMDFWIEEVQHRLRLIDEHAARRRRMIEATQALYAEDIRLAGPMALPGVAEALTAPNASDVSVDWEALAAEACELRERVLKSIRLFVRRCAHCGLIDADRVRQLEDLLGIDLRRR